MEKILLEVLTPANGKTYAFMLGGETRVSKAVESLIDEITAFENGSLSFRPESTLLFDCGTQEALDPDATLHACGIRGGERLILI